MDTAKPNMLFVEDDRVDQMAFKRFARKEALPYAYRIAGSVAEARRILETERFDVAVVDYLLGDGVAFDLFKDLHDTPIVVVTGIGNEEIAVTAMKAGAYDYLIKDAAGNYLKTLPMTVANAIKRKQAEEELIQYKEHLEQLVASRTAELKREIDERKRAEQELLEIQKDLEKRVEERTAELSHTNAELARASRLKDEFLANMSHELRTPLNVILGMAEALQEHVYGQLNAQQVRSLHMIQESGHHLLTLINDVLDLSKIGAGKLKLDIGPVSIETVCQTAVRLTRQMAQKKNITVSTHFDPEVTMLSADGRRLKQIFVNLLSNAVKFTPEGGEMGLTVAGNKDRDAVHVTVWDTGIGIAREDMARLFQPFTQLDASLTRKYEGTGLGLSLVYRMVEMHGGSIAVESEVGQGSRFTVSLPWHPPESTDSQNEPSSSQMTTATRQQNTALTDLAPIILLAEDNEATINALGGYLIAKGYRLSVARNGWEAFAFTKEYQPDLILMDIQMPDLDGLEAIRYIRNDAVSSSIPIIALTALAMPGDREKCLDAGANEYLSKPVSLRHLSTLISQLLEGAGRS